MLLVHEVRRTSDDQVLLLHRFDDGANFTWEFPVGVTPAEGFYEVTRCVVPPKSPARTRTLAQLRQSAWEATQWLSYRGVIEFVESVMREVESDEP